ncbi:PorV/PorQ family protein [Flavobacteriaceae bacterium Ap0902]|nr:PorV/PorQ family protein [Flavobacteriaceae bacterium Ap0902]
MRKSISLLILLCSISLSAQFRSYSNEFLNIGVDARAFGMGNAVVAHISDVNAAYWNPAGLAQIGNDWQAAAMHAEYFQSIAKYDYLAAAIPLDNSNALGVSIYRFGVDGILNTTELIDAQGNIDYDRISTFSASDYALQLSYAGNIFNLNNINFGLNAKLVYRNIGKFANAYGFGLDAGMQYRNRNFALGVMVRDITSTFNAWNVNEDALNQLEIDGTILNEPPEETIELTLPKIQLGVSQKVDFNDKFSGMGELDLNFNLRDGSELVSSAGLSFSPAAGIEVGYDEMVFIRAGVNNFQRTENFQGDQEIQFQPNVGLGFKYKGISIDYALTDIGDQSVALYSNIFSVKIDMEEFY